MSDIGATIHRVRTVHMFSNDNPWWKDITRWDEVSGIRLGRNATFILKYFDTAGNKIALPLTPDIIRDNLASILVPVRVESEKLLRSKEKYSTEAQQEVVIRNLVMNRS
ncbi:MAG: hypothetical protein IT292_06815 [Deltaproteobacteria bacterium]|nr:hypothetical protein [Deltaproteobacteria bacterium]